MNEPLECRLKKDSREKAVHRFNEPTVGTNNATAVLSATWSPNLEKACGSTQKIQEVFFLVLPPLPKKRTRSLASVSSPLPNALPPCPSQRLEDCRERRTLQGGW